eukprot:Sspe_Gene.63760::Locus_36905_Transcript_1_1_Confidence_1.000_Length_367::g.63760::m.63760
MSTLPPPPPTHPATATGHIPADSIGPLPAHLSDIGSPERQNSIQRPYVGSPAPSPRYGSTSPAGVFSGSPHRYTSGSPSGAMHTSTAHYATASPRHDPGF